MKDKKAYKPCDLVIYGALGDLSRRKLIISLYRLENANLLERDTRIIGVDRHAYDQAQFIEIAHASLQEFLSDQLDETVWLRFSARLAYVQIDLTQFDQYKLLKTVTDAKTRVMVNYFAVSPFLFKNICQGLNQAGILTKESRMVMEKPIGHNLKSSKEINDVVA